MSEIKTQRSSSVGYDFQATNALQQNFNTSITIQDMINSTKKCVTQWGIDGYAVLANGGPLTANPKYSFSKKPKNFATINDKLVASFPAASDHHKEMSWNSPHGKFLPGNRKSIIVKEAEYNQYKPSPAAYKPVVTEKAKFIPFSKGEKINFLSDAEFLGNLNPGAGKYEPSTKLTKERSSGFKYYSEGNNKPKGWKIEKTTLPDSACYNTEKADKLVHHTSPKYAEAKAKIVAFSEYQANQTKIVPGAGHYNPEASYRRLYKPMRKW